MSRATVATRDAAALAAAVAEKRFDSIGPLLHLEPDTLYFVEYTDENKKEVKMQLTPTDFFRWRATSGPQKAQWCHIMRRSGFAENDPQDINDDTDAQDNQHWILSVEKMADGYHVSYHVLQVRIFPSKPPTVTVRADEQQYDSEYWTPRYPGDEVEAAVVVALALSRLDVGSFQRTAAAIFDELYSDKRYSGMRAPLLAVLNTVFPNSQYLPSYVYTSYSTY